MQARIPLSFNASLNQSPHSLGLVDRMRVVLREVTGNADQSWRRPFDLIGDLLSERMAAANYLKHGRAAHVVLDEA
jgi:hypothetical protein